MPRLLLYDHTSSICSQMARLALVEKGMAFERRQIDIMETSEQFSPWYVALNPRAVVPTLVIDDSEVVTDTIHIVKRVERLDGPDLRGDATTEGWLRDIMALHYGVLLYRRRLGPEGTAPQIVARGKVLEALLAERPDLDELLTARLDGNQRFQALLRDSAAIEHHVEAARDLVGRMAKQLAHTTFLAGESYSLADCFATAALARFVIHGFSGWWQDTPVAGYYARMKARPSFVAAEVIDIGSERDL